MAQDAIIAELRAAAGSLITATAAAESQDWPTAEMSALDAQDRLARLLKEISIKLIASDPIQNTIPPSAAKRGSR
jgi:hypothetical protein